MKILIIRNFPSYMDVKNNTYNIQEVGLAKALVRKGNICDIVFWTDKEEEDVEIPVEGYGKVKVFYRHGITMLKNTVFSKCNNLFDQYDILQPCEYNQMQAWLLAKNKPNKTVIYHGPYYSKFNKRYNIMCKIFDKLFLKRYIKQGTKFIVKSNLAKDFLIEKGISKSNICVAGVGIDTSMLENSSLDICKEKLFLKMKEDKENLKFLYVGKFEDRRNIPFILDVFYQVQKKYSKVRLYLVGSGDAEYIEKVFKYANQKGISGSICWQEKIEQKYLAEIYEMSDFFLLPTEYEIFGMVLLEAMYHKNVILTTNNGGSSTLIKNEINGFILRKMNSQVWSKCILKLLKDKNKIEDIKKRASLTVFNKYTWDKISQYFLNEYEIRRRN